MLIGRKGLIEFVTRMIQKASKITNGIDGSRKYYGTGVGGTKEASEVKLRPFPIGTCTDRIDPVRFDILTENIPQTETFVHPIPEINGIVQVREKLDAEPNVTEIFEDYTNPAISNHSEKVICTDIGLKIKDEYIVESNGQDENGFYKFNLHDFINVNEIGSDE